MKKNKEQLKAKLAELVNKWWEASYKKQREVFNSSDYGKALLKKAQQLSVA